jgi:hypothetical protein
VYSAEKIEKEIMLDLAISDDTDHKGETIALTNHGRKMRASDWPQDCDFQLVSFSPSARVCHVVWTEAVARDIDRALHALNEAGVLPRRKPEWYRRLAHYAKGATSV